MPDAHFNNDGLSGQGDYTELKAFIDGFIGGLSVLGISQVGTAFADSLKLIVDPKPVLDPPTPENNGPGNDVPCTAPDFEPEEHVTYTVGFRDNIYQEFTDDGHEISPNQTLAIAGGYNTGRQFCILAHGLDNPVPVPGALSEPLT